MAISLVVLEGLTLKPTIIALEALASTTSLSVIVPIPERMTFTLTPSKAINLSPALGLSLKPVISTGIPGPASIIASPKSLRIVLILP